MPALSPRCQSLLSLGQPDSVYRDPWPDYLRLYGFTDQDVPDLLMMVADPDYDELDEDDPEVWAIANPRCVTTRAWCWRWRTRRLSV